MDYIPFPSHFQSSWLHSKKFTMLTKPLFICQHELRTRVVEEGDLVVNYHSYLNITLNLSWPGYKSYRGTLVLKAPAFPFVNY